MVTGKINYKQDIMKIMNIKFYQRKSHIRLTILCAMLMTVVYSCVKNDDIIYGIDDEPDAIIGFVQKEAILMEGGKPIKIQINTSKFLFEDATFRLVAVSGDINGIIFSDMNGAEGNSFTIEKGTKAVSLNINVKDDDKYTGTRTITYVLEILKGEGVFIPEESVGSSEKKLFVEFVLTIEDDEAVPPSLGFNALSGEVYENATEAHFAIIKLTTPATKAGSFDVSFTGTAIAGTDYNSNAINGVLTVNFEAGTEIIKIEVTPIDNKVVDGNKTVILTLSNLSEHVFFGEVSEYVITIVDDDLPIIETIIIAEADAWTRGRVGSAKANENGGDKTDLVASGSDKDDDFREFYLKFDLGAIDPSKVTEAKIVLTTTRESSWTHAETNFGSITTQSMYHVKDDSWGEMTVTANTQPAAGAIPIATHTSDFLIGQTSLSNLEHEFNVTAQLQFETDGKLSVRINTVNTLGQRVFYSSREHVSGAAPKLIVIESFD